MQQTRPASTACRLLPDKRSRKVPSGLVGECHRSGGCSHQGCDRGCFIVIGAEGCNTQNNCVPAQQHQVEHYHHHQEDAYTTTTLGLPLKRLMEWTCAACNCFPTQQLLIT
ncbi:hypothetical protein HaLaN_06164 [Haematococcus lacustris]|uniref:Uncharacterized protein n=1 Tax=Haematococcus lacustris TaxID=44745 RepID=A0A699YUX1_HAELA|nr:hypothetical protein HaLaN_06164 [Haematococcus lacustris]